MRMLDKQTDILCFQEHWLPPEQLNLLSQVCSRPLQRRMKSSSRMCSSFYFDASGAERIPKDALNVASYCVSGTSAPQRLGHTVLLQYNLRVPVASWKIWSQVSFEMRARLKRKFLLAVAHHTCTAVRCISAVTGLSV